VRRAGNRGGLGSFRHDLYRRRGRTYAVRATGSRTLELAAHGAAWGLACAGHRMSILPVSDGAFDNAFHAVSGAHAPRRCNHHLERGLCDRFRTSLFRILLSSWGLLAGNAACHVVWVDLADIQDVGSLP